MNHEQQLRADIGALSSDPLGFVRYAFPWRASSELAESSGPRDWQKDILETIGEHVRGPERFQPLQIAVSSGHGIGKSALIGQVITWAMSTCEDCRVALTANTEAQLRTKTWPEVSKWFRLALNAHWWNVTATSITVKEKAHERQWRADAIAWSENNTEAFAGLHNKGKRIVVVYDEASAIPSTLWEVTEGALTDEETEIIWLAFGNPTQNTGRFKECFGRYRHRWITKQIDSRTVDGTNKAQLDKWVEDYGEDSDFCRVRVRGEFPRAGASQFISGELVADARRRTVTGFAHHWKVLSVDVARFGDDQTVIGLRQGPKLTILDKLRGEDTVQVARRTMQHMKEHTPRLTVIDGTGLGAGVVDIVRDDMRPWFKANHPCSMYEFHGSASAKDGLMYFNQRAEVWGLMREWLKTGDIPNDPELETDLTGPQYFFSNKNLIQMEKKEDMKKRGLASPDAGDMLAMTFTTQPHGKTHDEKVMEEIEAAPSEFGKHLIRLRETERRSRTSAPKAYWE